MTSKKAIDAAKIIVEYCKEQKGCQNCVFREHSPDHWNCHIDAFDLRNVLDNLAAKKKNNGYIS